MHRLRVSAWPGDVYLKSHRPSCTFFGYIPGFGPPGALKSAIWRRFSIDFCRIRAPMRGHRRKMACFSHISPHGRSKLDDVIGKQSRRSIDAKRSLSECSMGITRPPQGARSVGIALSWCRWTPTTALPMALLAQSRGPKSGKYQKNVQDGR